MDNLNIFAFASIGSILGTLLTTYLNSYFTEKGKSLATKEDIEEITSKIESVKNLYLKALESYKNELRKEYDISKPALDLTMELDKNLINKVHDLKTLVFEYRNFGGSEIAVQIISKISALSKFIVGYHSRYKNLIGVKEIIDINNTFAKMKDEPKSDIDVNSLLKNLSENLDNLLSYFLIPLSI